MTFTTIYSTLGVLGSAYIIIHSKWREKRQGVMRLSAKVMEDLFAFQMAFLEHANYLNSQPEVASEGQGDTSALRIVPEREMISAQKLEGTIRQLRGDITILALTFDRRSIPVERELTGIFEMAISQLRSRRRSLDEWQDNVLTPAVDRIYPMMRDLWLWTDSWRGMLYEMLPPMRGFQVTSR